jgi:hypothetical protein
MQLEIPSADELTAQALRFRKKGRYAAHPVEVALRYHCAQAEKSGAESHGGLDLNRPKSTTEQALKGYDFLKSQSSRKASLS